MCELRFFEIIIIDSNDYQWNIQITSNQMIYIISMRGATKLANKGASKTSGLVLVVMLLFICTIDQSIYKPWPSDAIWPLQEWVWCGESTPYTS